MSAREFAEWAGFYQLEHREQEQARQRAENKANARAIASRMRA
jgi:hypothetical protein